MRSSVFDGSKGSPKTKIEKTAGWIDIGLTNSMQRKVFASRIDDVIEISCFDKELSDISFLSKIDSLTNSVFGKLF